MKTLSKNRWTRFLLLGVLILGTLCLGKSEILAEQKPKVAVIPFITASKDDPARGAVCPICREAYRKGDLPPGAQQTLTRLLHQKMTAFGTFDVLSLERVEEAMATLKKGQIDETPIPSSLQVGKELNADFVLVGFMYRFEERVGSSWGVEKPASVGFDLHLLHLRDSQMVWSGNFDETQAPLSENVLKLGSFLRRKASWLTAEELAGVGMDEMLKKFPTAKELEEAQ
jgi:hypothetical protein